MKKLVLLTVMALAAVMGTPSAQAQTTPDTLDVPFGMFESWDSYPADTLSLMGGMINLPVNYDYQLPTGWGVPVYEVNESIPYMGMTLPLSFSLPVAVAYPDTMFAPEGDNGLVARTFRLQDVMTPTIYTLMSGFMDSTLTEMVIPSVLLTGQLNLDSILPLLTRIVGHTDNMGWMLSMVDSTDINNYITGGFALNGFRPGKLMGKFIYTDPGEGDDDDCAAVIMIGTRYDTLQHRRMLVGAGVKTLYELYDTTAYEPFDFEYVSLSSYFPESYGYYEADSMVVMVVSSASDKGFQYGSRIFLDQLQLVSRPEPCGQVTNLHVEENTPMFLHLAWNNTASPSGWEMEYGTAGFVRGTGTRTTLSDSNAYFYSLEPNTRYDFYLQGWCGDTAETEWVYLSVLTDSLPDHQGIDEVYGEKVRVYPNPAQGRCTVDLEGVKASAVRMYSADGRLVKETAVTDERQLELTLPATGLYIVEVRTALGNLHRRVVGN